MTATIEEEVRQNQNNLAAQFVMPKPCLGQAVTWYSSGDRSCVGEMAFVLNVGRRNLVINRASGSAMESVRHIDDPKLQLSAEQRESGAWDFTEETKTNITNVNRIAALEAAVAEQAERSKALEELFNEPAKKPKADKA